MQAFIVLVLQEFVQMQPYFHILADRVECKLVVAIPLLKHIETVNSSLKMTML